MKQTVTTIALLLLLVVGLTTVMILRLGKKHEGEQAAGDPSQIITLKGATQFGADHAFTRTIRKFEELVKEYYGKPVEFELYLNSELGLEKDYFAYMQGISLSEQGADVDRNDFDLVDLP